MIRVGIGGWNFAPWRGEFYPAGTKQADELKYASRHLTTIEINGTFYRAQSPASFKKWRDETPDGFMFSIKGHRAIVMSRQLAETGEKIDWFLKSGMLELGDKLGPFLWQLAPNRKFDPDDLGAFLKLLPKEMDGQGLKHAIEVRHESYFVPEFLKLLRAHNAAVVYADSDEYPAIADVTADFVYARLQKTQDKIKTGYSPADLDRWAERSRIWESNGAPADLPRIDDKQSASKKKRDVFVYMISGAKVRNPAAAMALIERVKG